jgi:predicted dehydrogenase
MKKLLLLFLIVPFIVSCGTGGSKKKADSKTTNSMEQKYPVRLVTVDPGHFHAALVQKIMYPQVSPDVHVYAPEGPDVTMHLGRIKAYNTRTENPTSWNEVVYTGPDFFEKMLEEKAGNVVVLSGNNKKKAEYISRSVNAGLNVLADKPMIINPSDFKDLVSSFKTAGEKGLILYDIMTERHEVTTLIQKMLSQDEQLFGKLLNGTKDEPAYSSVSVHNFSKLVSGVPLQRPAWFFDVDQQGEGIVDVSTHLVDLVQWECFPAVSVDTSDVLMSSAKRWPTVLTKDQFKAVTGLEEFPDYLMKDVADGKLNVFANGEIVYEIKGVWAKVTVIWDYMPPAGAGDTYSSLMRGSNCELIIRQGSDEKYLPTLYVKNMSSVSPDEFSARLKKAVASLPYDSLTMEAAGKGIIKINIPARYRVTHEEHFGQVTEDFLRFLEHGKLPEWEVPGMITKYFITTKALEMSKMK